MYRMLLRSIVLTLALAAIGLGCGDGSDSDGDSFTPTLVPTMTPTPNCAVTVTGKVYDAVDGPSHRVVGAHVSVSLSVPRSFDATTDENGTYSLAVPDLYGCTIQGLGVSASGYASQSLSVTLTDLQARPIRDFALER